MSLAFFSDRCSRLVVTERASKERGSESFHWAAGHVGDVAREEGELGSRRDESGVSGIFAKRHLP